MLDIAGRVGWDFNGTLPYIKAGFALADVNSSWSLNTYSTTGTGGNFSTSKNSWQPGFVIGGGVEQQIGPGWSVRGEISWMDFATQTLANPVPGVRPAGAYVGGTGGQIKFKDSLFNATVGINYRF